MVLKSNGHRLTTKCFKSNNQGSCLYGDVANAQVIMADMIISVSSLENFNNINYSTWSTRIQFYLFGQDLWEIVGVVRYHFQ